MSWGPSLLNWSIIVQGDRFSVVQESEVQKAAWSKEAQRVFPLGCHVQVISSDEEVYVGKTGRVVGYDEGYEGSYPMIDIEFIVPMTGEEIGDSRGIGRVEDGFYDDELRHLSGIEQLALVGLNNEGEEQ